MLSSYNVRPEDQTQVDRFDHKELKVLINLTGPWFQLLQTLLNELYFSFIYFGNVFWKRIRLMLLKRLQGSITQKYRVARGMNTLLLLLDFGEL